MTIAALRENLSVAVDTLRVHKGRSALTVLGVVIGVTSVIAVASIISGLNHTVQDRVESLGSRTYFLGRLNLASGFGRISEKIRKRKYFEYGDADYLREDLSTPGERYDFRYPRFRPGTNQRSELQRRAGRACVRSRRRARICADPAAVQRRQRALYLTLR
jgi:putative ABC transport system permease protein